jgi:pyruvate dehydrogenase E2 component (dihydrolipoamide acetyltransferase)
METSEEEIEATDAAKRKAEELDVDLSGVEGTGQGGRITVGDVEKAARGDE